MPLASVITTVAPGSPSPVIVGVLSFVILSLSLVPVSEDASKSASIDVVVSIVTSWVVVVVFPAVSVAVIVRVWEPSASSSVVIE